MSLLVIRYNEVARFASEVVRVANRTGRSVNRAFNQLSAKMVAREERKRSLDPYPMENREDNLAKIEREVRSDFQYNRINWQPHIKAEHLPVIIETCFDDAIKAGKKKIITDFKRSAIKTLKLSLTGASLSAAAAYYTYKTNTGIPVSTSGLELVAIVLVAFPVFYIPGNAVKKAFDFWELHTLEKKQYTETESGDLRANKNAPGNPQVFTKALERINSQHRLA